MEQFKESNKMNYIEDKEGKITFLYKKKSDFTDSIKKQFLNSNLGLDTDIKVYIFQNKKIFIKFNPDIIIFKTKNVNQELYKNYVNDIFHLLKKYYESLPQTNEIISFEKLEKMIGFINASFNKPILSFEEIEKVIIYYNFIITYFFKLMEYAFWVKKETFKLTKLFAVKNFAYVKAIRPIDLLYLKNLWELDNQDYQKYLPQVKELLKTQLTDEYYKIFLQIPSFFPFSHITQKELDFYAGKIKEYKANIPWIWKIVLKLDKPILSEEEYQEYSKKLSELKEKYLGETQQDILNLQEEIKFNSIEDLIQAIREHKLKEFWKIKEEYWINKDKEKLKKSILNLVKKHYKPYNKLSNEEKKLVEKLIIWVEVNSK